MSKLAVTTVQITRGASGAAGVGIDLVQYPNGALREPIIQAGGWDSSEQIHFRSVDEFGNTGTKRGITIVTSVTLVVAGNIYLIADVNPNRLGLDITALSTNADSVFLGSNPLVSSAGGGGVHIGVEIAGGQAYSPPPDVNGWWGTSPSANMIVSVAETTRFGAVNANRFIYSLLFGGSGSIGVQTSWTSPFGPNMSVSAWIYPLDRSAPYVVVGTDNGTAQSYLRVETNGDVTWQPNSAGAAATFAGANIPFGTSGGVPQWTHLAFTRSATSISLYINGVLFGTQAFSTALTSPQGNFALGQRTSGLNCFHGNIAETIVWSRVLTASEVANVYNYGLVSGNALNTLYQFVTGSGTSLIDFSGNGHSGTISGAGAPTWSTTIPPVPAV